MRFGLIGTAYWARTVHGPAILTHPSVSLAGVWGRHPGKAAAAARELGVPRYESVEEMFNDVDAVAIAVQPDAQPALAVSAAEHGCNLLLDKPLALNLQLADHVVKAAENSGVRGVLFSTMQYTSNVADWQKGLSRDGWIASRVRLFRAMFVPGNPYQNSAWRQKKGALWDIGPHALSVVLPVLGTAESVVAQRGINDGVEVVIRHSSGAITSLSLSLTVPEEAQGSECQLWGPTGSITMPRPGEPPLDAMGRCISALIGPSDHAVERTDLILGRDIVAILATAESYLDEKPRNAIKIPC